MLMCCFVLFLSRNEDIPGTCCAGVEEANMHWSGKTKRWSEIL